MGHGHGLMVQQVTRFESGDRSIIIAYKYKTLNTVIHKKIEQKASKRTIIENIDLIENKFESSDDEDYMRELDNVFKTYQCEDECKSKDNIP